jgi:hypothetical protein
MAKAKPARKRHDDAALTKKILALRSKDKKWADIGDQLGITPGKAQFLAMVSEVKPKDRIKFTDDEDLADKVVCARDDDLLSWGLIAARSGVSEGKIKRLYEEAGGKGPQNVASARKGDDEAKPRKAKGKGAKGGKAKSAKAKVARKGKGRRKGKGKRGKSPSTAS